MAGQNDSPEGHKIGFGWGFGALKGGSGFREIGTRFAF
jgi:hypothetical protein